MRGPRAYVVGRALEAMFNRALSQFGELPVPHDNPVVHTVGPDADRLFLIGTGTVRGLGVTSNQLGLGGQLARRVSPLTGRGVDLEMASATTLLIHEAAALLGGYDTSRFDAIIMVMGIRDTVRLTSPADWRRDMGELLAAASQVPRVFLVAIPDFTTYTELAPYAKRVIRRHAARLNEESRRLAAATPGVVYVPVDPVDPGHFVRPGSIEVYEIFADAVAPAIARGLDPTVHALRPADRLTEQVRQDALDALGVIGSGDDPSVDRITRLARDLLGASGASVTFLDHDRKWIKSAVSVSSDDMPRVDAFCNTTIAKSQLFVVEDATKDARFASHPWVVGDDHVMFYAGYPLEAPEGVPIGALCVVDTKPRRFSDAEASLLRDLALRVQELLWAGSRSRRT
ncbi:MAG: GAF domain-containing protein [Pseudolysinimonas sp.]